MLFLIYCTSSLKDIAFLIDTLPHHLDIWIAILSTLNLTSTTVYDLSIAVHMPRLTQIRGHRLSCWNKLFVKSKDHLFAWQVGTRLYRWIGVWLHLTFCFHSSQSRCINSRGLHWSSEAVLELLTTMLLILGTTCELVVLLIFFIIRSFIFDTVALSRPSVTLFVFLVIGTLCDTLLDVYLLLFFLKLFLRWERNVFELVLNYASVPFDEIYDPS